MGRPGSSSSAIPGASPLELRERDTAGRHRAGNGSRATGPAPQPTGTRAAERRKRRRARRRRLLEWPILVGVALVAAILIRQFLLQSFYIPSGSMKDTLLINDRIVVNKLSYHLHSIHRGDVVVFDRPKDVKIPDKELVKRVIGLPGDSVQGKDGSVYINDHKLVEPYVRAACHGTESFAKISVPEDKIFVMGDNRCDSYDSRFFGPISQKLVVGRAFARIWPFSRIGAL
jgi:signal peptidase I